MYSARTSRPSFPGAGERARLSIKGVRCPVGLRVARRREGQVTLVQELPFLALGNDVQDEQGRTGKIARVAVSIDHGVPKLVIELAYDVVTEDERPSGPPAVKTPVRLSGRERDQTIGYDERPTIPSPLRHARLRQDDTNRELTLAFRCEPPSAASFTPRRRPEDEGVLDFLLARLMAVFAMIVALVSPRTT